MTCGSRECFNMGASVAVRLSAARQKVERICFFLCYNTSVLFSHHLRRKEIVK